ncbi:MAG: hypothetical protein OEM15_03610 [Myxococcales bacterium]|nr:hypothetical protein [Myxococcales bacterium]MDH3485826.1 hypothetical protein [Myxococcales bacterium]
MSRERFVELMTPALSRFSQDLKSVLRIVEDPEIDDESRIVAAGGLLHVISSVGAIPGVRGVLRHLGDVLVIRLMLDRIRTSSSDAFERYVAESPEMLEPLSDELEAMHAYLGDRVRVLERVVDKFPKLQHQGHQATGCIGDTESSNWLYDAVHEVLIDEIEFDDDDVARELKQVDQILDPLSARLNR